jgi:hypothetical protein
VNPGGRRFLLIAALGPLAGCPLPQPVAEYPATGTIAPPRIKIADVSPIDTFVLVDPDACTDPVFTLSAKLVDDNTVEAVDARWFLDYDPADLLRQRPIEEEQIPPPDAGAIDPRERDVEPYLFQAYVLSPAPVAGDVHVIELVVSNGFAPEPTPPPPPGWRPYRMPATNFETQVFRWVFRYVPGGACSYP